MPDLHALSSSIALLASLALPSSVPAHASSAGKNIATSQATAPYDVVIRNGLVFDGTGSAGKQVDIAIKDGRIVQIAPSIHAVAKQVIGAKGMAVAPGFINMLSWSNESLLVDGLGQSVLRQGVTLEVMGEGFSMGPITPQIRQWMSTRQGEFTYDISWNTLGGYLDTLEQRGVAVNVASYVGAGTVRMTSLGMEDKGATSAQIETMQSVVHDAMVEGAMGVASSLIYPPGSYADTDELKALAFEAGRCGGIYATHLRSEGDRFIEAADEAIEIASSTGTPLELFHLKVGGKANWPKMDTLLEHVENARANGHRVTADMYVYTASGTSLAASIPPWVQEGGVEAMIKRLRDPEVHARVLADMKDPAPGWDNIMAMAGGPENVRFISTREESLRPLLGKSLAEIGAMRDVSGEEALLQLVEEDGARPEAIYFTMSPDTLDTIITRPWMSFSSDGTAMAAEGDFLKISTHPRSYGNFARVYARYVREKGLLSLAQAIHRMTGLPARVLGLKDRGLLRSGFAADIVVFDPATIIDRATFLKPQQYATGVSHVLVNGTLALAQGKPTGAKPGRFVHGPGWTGWKDGGCRSQPSDWDRPVLPMASPKP